MMKLGLMENNTVILQVEEDHSSLPPPPRKRRISQSGVLEEQHKALKLQQEMVELKKKLCLILHGGYFDYVKLKKKDLKNIPWEFEIPGFLNYR